jgi:hypothetical protein
LRIMCSALLVLVLTLSVGPISSSGASTEIAPLNLSRNQEIRSIDTTQVVTVGFLPPAGSAVTTTTTFWQLVEPQDSEGDSSIGTLLGAVEGDLHGQEGTFDYTSQYVKSYQRLSQGGYSQGPLPKYIAAGDKAAQELEADIVLALQEDLNAGDRVFRHTIALGSALSRRPVPMARNYPTELAKSVVTVRYVTSDGLIVMEPTKMTLKGYIDQPDQARYHRLWSFLQAFCSSVKGDDLVRFHLAHESIDQKNW